MAVYREKVNIKGYGEFDKVVRVNRRGIFKIEYPEFIVKDNLTKIDYVAADTMKEAEEKWDAMVHKFESLHFKYKLVILFQIEERGSYRDGSGEGMVFMWGVFRQIDKGSKYYNEYVFERSYRGDEDISQSWHDLGKWRRLDWSQEREDFFIKISKSMEELYFKLDSFLKKPSEVDKQIKLLAQNNKKSLV